MKNKNKTVYLQNGEEADLLIKFQDENETCYVVKEIDYFCGGYQYKVYPKVYEKYEDTPIFLNKTKLEKEIIELDKRVNELKEQKEKLKRWLD